MQPVNLYEFLRKCIRHTVFVNGISNHTSEFRIPDINLRNCLSMCSFLEQVGEYAIPVCIECKVKSNVWKNPGCPFYGMYLGHHCCVDKTCYIEQASIVPIRVVGFEVIA